MLKKTFLIVAFLCLAFFVSACTKNEADKNGQQNQSETTDNQVVSDDLRTLSLAADLPTCPADTSGLFTKPFIDGDKPDFIIPLGNSNQEGHVVPVDHVYFNNTGYEKNMPVYAPSDMTLIWIENKQMHNKNTDAVTRDDYQLHFAPCRGLNLAFIHIKKFSEKLDEAVDDTGSNCVTNQKMDYGTLEGIPTYYITCHPDFKKIRFSAGEIVGYYSGASDKQYSGIDIGLYDYNKPGVGFVNPNRYYDVTNHTVCFADYYTPELRSKYLTKFGGLRSKGSDTQVVVKRTAEPVCGKIMYDQVGTAAGNWYDHPVKVKNVTDNDALILMRDNIEPELAKLTMARVISFTFSPKHSGQINREFSEVTADGKIYCYSRDEQNTKEKVLLQLIDETHMKVEKLEGACGSNETFINPTNYER